MNQADDLGGPAIAQAILGSESRVRQILDEIARHDIQQIVIRTKDGRRLDVTKTLKVVLDDLEVAAPLVRNYLEEGEAVQKFWHNAIGLSERRMIVRNFLGNTSFFLASVFGREVPRVLEYLISSLEDLDRNVPSAIFTPSNPPSGRPQSSQFRERDMAAACAVVDLISPGRLSVRSAISQIAKDLKIPTGSLVSWRKHLKANNKPAAREYYNNLIAFADRHPNGREAFIEILLSHIRVGFAFE